MLDGAARLPTTSQLARTARDVPLIVAVDERAPFDRIAALEAIGGEVLRLPGAVGVPVAPLLEELGRRGMTNVLLEGGGRVLGSFLDAGEVDEVDAFVAPIVEGGEPAFTPARGRGVAAMAEALRLVDLNVSQLDGDVRIQGRVPRPWLEPAG